MFMAGYQKLSVLLSEELDQLEEEGREFCKKDYLKKIEECKDDKESLLLLYDELCRLPRRNDYPYIEPSSFDEIMAEASPAVKVCDINSSLLEDKLYGAWLGRCIGCAVGQPVEGWSRADIKKWCEGADAYPLSGYIPTHSRAEEAGMKFFIDACTTEHIDGMPSDDDIRFTVLGLDMMKKIGTGFDSWDVGSHWLSMLPLRFVCTAETQSYLNFANLDCNGPWKVKPDNAAELARESALYLNPYREWIGAQIRIDAYGYVSAGNPAKAARLAYEDAAFSHVKNGIYGAMFFSAFIAAAFSSDTIKEAAETALSFVPMKSRLYETLKRAIQIGESAKEEEDLLESVLKVGEKYNWVHTINNAAICTAVLIYTSGVIEEAVPLAVMAGLDTDCNGATVGSICGAFSGACKLPDSLKTPLRDTLFSELPGYHPIAISELARQTLEVIKK